MQPVTMKSILRVALAALVCLAICAGARADEGGASFWLPGQFDSFAATPTDPGWSVPLIYYRYSGQAGAAKNFQIGGRIAAGLSVRSDLLFAVPTYTFAAPVLGGQATLGVSAFFGRIAVDASATLSGPGGAVLSRSASDSLTNVGDLNPAGSLRWNHGNHNLMAYTTLGVPVGSYKPGRLANLGSNHWAVDVGGGYTYLDAKSGREFSAVAGATYNFKNHATDYRNGNSLHLDWGASQTLSERWRVGLVGYFYQQVTGDSGSGARLGDFESRVAAIGPQVGLVFRMGGKQASLGFKGYKEFNALNRLEGWNVWLTLAIPIGSASQ